MANLDKNKPAIEDILVERNKPSGRRESPSSINFYAYRLDLMQINTGLKF
jgi:hypothetical protein